MKRQQRKRKTKFQPICSQEALRRKAEFERAMEPDLPHEPLVLWLRWWTEQEFLEDLAR